jgi:hypothetical protein
MKLLEEIRKIWDCSSSGDRTPIDVEMCTGKRGRQGSRGRSYSERGSRVKGLDENLSSSQRCFHHLVRLHGGHEYHYCLSNCEPLCKHPSPVVQRSTCQLLRRIKASHTTSPPPLLHEDFTTASGIVLPSSTSPPSSIATSATSTPTATPASPTTLGIEDTLARTPYPRIAG